ncbi:MAG: hypothetical protein ACHQX3_09770, partial [Nitrospirales bacterium]
MNGVPRERGKMRIVVIVLGMAASAWAQSQPTRETTMAPLLIHPKPAIFSPSQEGTLPHALIE